MPQPNNKKKTPKELNDTFWNSNAGRLARIDKPIQAVYPEFAILSGLRGANFNTINKASRTLVKEPFRKKERFDLRKGLDYPNQAGKALGLELLKIFTPFRNGGKVKLSDTDYYSIMEHVAKDNWKQWGDKSEDAALTRILNANDYDYRGYYNKYPNSRANSDTHWTDEFKLPRHSTFSNESKYSGIVSDYNPKGIKGGIWDGNNFIPSIEQINYNNTLNNMARINSRLACGGKRKLACGGRSRYTYGGNRPKAFWGAAIGTVLSGIGSAINAREANDAYEEYMRQQTLQNTIQNNQQQANLINSALQNNRNMQQAYQNEFENTIRYKCGGRKKAKFGWGNLFSSLGSLANITDSFIGNKSVGLNTPYQDINSPTGWSLNTMYSVNPQYTQGKGIATFTSPANFVSTNNIKYKCGGRKKARNGRSTRLSSLYITDGGVGIPFGDGLTLLRGATHEDINETGQTGIGIQVGRHQIEAENGEVAQKRNKELRIFSDQPMFNGVSPADAVQAGYNPDEIFTAQEVYKRMVGLKDDGTTYAIGGDTDDSSVSRRILRGWRDALFPFLSSNSNNNTSSNNRTSNNRTNRTQQQRNTRQQSNKRGVPYKPYSSGVNANVFDRKKSQPSISTYTVKDKYYDDSYLGANGLMRGLSIAFLLNKNNNNNNNNNNSSSSTQQSTNPSTINNTNSSTPKPTTNNNASKTTTNTTTSTTNRSNTNNTPKRTINNGANNVNTNNIRRNNRNVNRSKRLNNRGNRLRDITRFNAPLYIPTTDRTTTIEPRYYKEYTPEETITLMSEISQLPQERTLNRDESFRLTRDLNRIEYLNSKNNRRQQRNGGLTRSGSYGSSKKPYPNVKSSDFAGGGRSYPIPTKADARDALRLAGLHGRSDIRAKVLARYPSLRKKGKWGFSTPVEENNRLRYANGGNWWYDYTNDFLDAIAPKRVIDNRPIWQRNLSSSASNNTSSSTTKLSDGITLPEVIVTPNGTTVGDYTTRNNGVNSLALSRAAARANWQDRYGMDIRNSDWIGLGTDLLGSIGTGLINGLYLNDLNVDYTLPQYVDETPVAFDTTWHNGAQRANIERNRINVRNTIGRNTASSNTAVQRMQAADTSAMMQQNELWDEKANKETELRNTAAANEQQVRARNAAARNAYYQQVAQIRNAEQDANNALRMARGQALNATLQGIAGAANNFLNQTTQRYEDNQAMLAHMVAGQPGSVARMLASGYGDSALGYRLYRMNDANAVDKPIAPNQSDYDLTTESGRQAYNNALQLYNTALIPYNDYSAIRNLALARINGNYRLGGKINKKKLSCMR